MTSVHAASGSPELRLVLLGNSGVGKSATGNAILGREAFRETETTECEIQRGRVNSRNISVIDTPGINSTALSTDQLKTEIERSLSLSAPGPHLFLLVIRVRRFTEDTRNTVKCIQENFGEEALKFTMVLFTGREEMTNRQWVCFEERNIQDFSRQFGGRYSVINSKREVSPAHISKLLKNINEMVRHNRGQHYSKHMYNEPQIKKADEAEGHGEEKKKTGRDIQERRRSDESEERQEGQIQKQEWERKEEGRDSEISQESMNNKAEEEEEVERIEEEQTNLATVFSSADDRSAEILENQRPRKERQLNRQSIEITSLHKGIRTGDHSWKEPSRERTVGSIKYPSKAKREKERNRSKRKDLRRQMESRREVPDTGSDVRIVLVGRAGTGKSATGNTILGREAIGKDLTESLRTYTRCRRLDGMVGSQSVTVIDTKGNMQVSLFSPSNPVVLTPSQFEECMRLCSAGPHVFLLVICSPNFLWAYETFHPLKEHFGGEFLKRSIVVITHGDKWGRIQDFSRSLEKLVDSCGGSYHIFNNEEQEDRTQVTELLEKIEAVVEKYRGQHYTYEMYQEAQRKRREELSSCSLL